MTQRLCRTSATLGMLIVVLSCSSERPNRSSFEIVPLTAMPLSADPVLWSSPVLDVTKLDDTLHRIDLDSIIRSREFRQLELRVTWARASCADNIDIWNPLTSSWEFIERRDVPYGCVGSKCPGKRMISDLGISPASLLEATNNVLTFRRDRNRWIQCQILDLDSRYQRIDIPYLTYVSAMAWNSELYVSTATRPSPEGSYDSLRVYAANGVLKRALPLDVLPTSMTWSPEGLWIMHGYRPVHFSLCDSNGIAQGEFTYPADKCVSWASSISSGVIWYRDHLLVNDVCDSMIYLIDPHASMALGQAVIADSISFREDSGEIATDGNLIFTIAGILNAYSPRGRLVFQLPAPSAPHCAAWDGNALWVAHRGCGEAKSEDLVISRFALE